MTQNQSPITGQMPVLEPTVVLELRLKDQEQRLNVIESALDEGRRARERIRVWILGALLAIVAWIYQSGDYVGRSSNTLERLSRDQERMERHIESLENAIRQHRQMPQ